MIKYKKLHTWHDDKLNLDLTLYKEEEKGWLFLDEDNNNSLIDNDDKFEASLRLNEYLLSILGKL